MEYLGYVSAIFIGIALGLVGAGGSILTIPVLVYMIGIPVIHATSYSLFIVGISAMIASMHYLRYNLLCLRTVIVFGFPSVLSVFLTRKYFLHAIPDQLFLSDTLAITKDSALMVLLAVLMAAAAFSMIRKSKVVHVDASRENDQFRYFLIFQQGIIVGVLVGLVGAGGGFIIIPALVILAKLPMKKAVGSSLAIVALNSSIGFLSDFDVHEFNWPFILIFSGFTIGGSFVGGYLSRYVSSIKLKSAFGWLILLMAAFILTREIFFSEIS